MADHISFGGGPRRIEPNATIPMAFVTGMLDGLRSKGHNPALYLEEAGISPDLLDEPAARVTAGQYVGLFTALIRAMGDDGLGFFSRPLRRGCMALIAHSALEGATLQDAMRKATRAFGLLQDDVDVRFVHEGRLAGLSLHFACPPKSNFMQELLIRVLWRLFAWIAGGRLRLERIDFAFEAPPHHGEYAIVFPAPIRFGQTNSTFWFDASNLARPVRQNTESLHEFLRDVPSAVITPRWSVSTSAARVRAHLQRNAPHWPDLVDTAAALAMSTATLQRRLAAEHTSYQKLKDELRRDIAIIRLNTTKASVAEIGLELGFADSAAFQRAFKDWTGTAPGRYRR